MLALTEVNNLLKVIISETTNIRGDSTNSNIKSLLYIYVETNNNLTILPAVILIKDAGLTPFSTTDYLKVKNKILKN
jgi:hypothetical protein